MESNTFSVSSEAIGLILTGVGLFIAFLSILESNGQNKKNRDLEIRLRRQEKEQKRLDEYVQSVRKILTILSSEKISLYKERCRSYSYTKEDIQYIENLSSQFKELLQELYLKNHKVTSNNDFISIINYLERVNYYLQDLSSKFNNSQNLNLQEKLISSLIEDIKKLNNGMLPKVCQRSIFDIADYNSYLKRLLSVYSICVTGKIMTLQSEVEVNVEKYIKKEQERIDNLSIG